MWTQEIYCVDTKCVANRKLDVANRASLFYNEYFKSFKSKSSNIAGVIKNKSGEFSKCEKESGIFAFGENRKKSLST